MSAVMQKSGMEEKLPHFPVLYQEILNMLQPQQDGFYVDGTVGAGGHAWGILKASTPDGKLLGLDVDPQAIELAQERLASFKDRFFLLKSSYTAILDLIKSLNWNGVDGILLDLGFSSMQIESDRGFAFQSDSPLDMRFDPDNPRTAEKIVNELSEEELITLLFEFGEEEQARLIAKAIIHSRPVKTTRQLSDVIVSAVKGKKKQSRIHPATKTFQALRIVVNDELNSLMVVLPRAVAALRPGGRLAIISFHSLEDRIVKLFFRTESKDCICLPRQPICTCGHRATILTLTKHPIQPSEAEVVYNPRSRSARLRVAQKL
jgi:16S rRNA (cytosine1402-N4)-methyltransferase